MTGFALSALKRFALSVLSRTFFAMIARFLSPNPRTPNNDQYSRAGSLQLPVFST